MWRRNMGAGGPSGAHPLGCQAELGLHGLQQKCRLETPPASPEHPLSWTDLGVCVPTPGLGLALIQTSSFILPWLLLLQWPGPEVGMLSPANPSLPPAQPPSSSWRLEAYPSC